MRTSTLTAWLMTGAVLAAGPEWTCAQSLGALRWQLQPFCNVITVNVTQSGAVYTLDGYDDQCGAPQRAPLVGLATPNPDGTIGFGLQVVTTPSATPVAIRASITLAALGGAWSDSVGNSGTMVFNGAAAGSPRPATTAVSASAVNVTGAVTAGAVNVGGAVTATSANLGAVDATSLTTSALRTEGVADVRVASTLRIGNGLQMENGYLLMSSFGFAPSFETIRGSGTVAAPGFVVAGDRLASFYFKGLLAGPTGARRSGAAIHATATENWLSGNGGSLTFETGPNGSNVTVPRLFIDQNGEVGIGTVTPDQLLSVNGNASKVGGGTWAVFSDERLKHMRGTFTRGLSDLLRLQPMRFEYRADNPLGLRGHGEYVGFGAQAVREVIPEAVSVSESGYLQLHSDPLLWTMLNAIKELEGRTRTENQQLRAELVELRRALAAARDR